MLLNKYEKLTVFSKDEYCEELLFKIEKWAGKNMEKLEAQARNHLIGIIDVFSFDEDESDTEKLPIELNGDQIKEADQFYSELMPFAKRFDEVADSILYVWKALMARLNLKLQIETRSNLLEEVYRVNKEVGALV